jgi:hypothetical protein
MTLPFCRALGFPDYLQVPHLLRIYGHSQSGLRIFDAPPLAFVQSRKLEAAPPPAAFINNPSSDKEQLNSEPAGIPPDRESISS